MDHESVMVMYCVRCDKVLWGEGLPDVDAAKAVADGHERDHLEAEASKDSCCILRRVKAVYVP